MKCYLIYGLSACLLTAAPAWAQNAESGQIIKIEVGKGAKQLPTRTVSGIVINGATNQPMSGVLVSAAEIDGYSTFTAEDGTYKLAVPLIASQLYISAK